MAKRTLQGAFVGLIVGFIVTVFFGGTYSLPVWVLLPGVLFGWIVGGLVGVIVHLHEKYKKVINFRRHFLDSMQHLVDTCLQERALACDFHSKEVVSLQQSGLRGIKSRDDFDRLYGRLQDNFREVQKWFYEAYDAALAVRQIDEWWWRDIKLKERSFKVYLPKDEPTQSEQPTETGQVNPAFVTIPEPEQLTVQPSKESDASSRVRNQIVSSSL